METEDDRQPANPRALALRFKMYLSLSAPRLRAFLPRGKPLLADFSMEYRCNALDLITRHNRTVQSQFPVDLWITLLPFLDSLGIRKTCCLSAMTMFLVLENPAVRKPGAKKGKSNEIFIEVEEKVTVRSTPLGEILSQIDGAIDMRCYIPNPPELTMKLESKLLQDELFSLAVAGTFTSRIPPGTTAGKIPPGSKGYYVTFTPPDSEFRLLTYADFTKLTPSSDLTSLPLVATAAHDESSNIVTVTLRIAEVSDKSKIVLFIPVTGAVTATCSSGHAVYNSRRRGIIWTTTKWNESNTATCQYRRLGKTSLPMMVDAGEMATCLTKVRACAVPISPLQSTPAVTKWIKSRRVIVKERFHVGGCASKALRNNIMSRWADESDTPVAVPKKKTGRRSGTLMTVGDPTPVVEVGVEEDGIMQLDLVQREDGTHKGYGYITFETAEHMQRACSRTAPWVLGGQTLVLEPRKNVTVRVVEPPPQMVICALHGKSRSVGNMVVMVPGQWQCLTHAQCSVAGVPEYHNKPRPVYGNTVVEGGAGTCAVHGKSRTFSNMVEAAPGRWECKPGNVCNADGGKGGRKR